MRKIDTFLHECLQFQMDAKAVSNRPNLAAFKPICDGYDGYEGYYTDSNYADTPKKWLVIRSQARRERALKTFGKDLAKGKMYWLA